jgi:hypothetical protein
MTTGRWQFAVLAMLLASALSAEAAIAYRVQHETGDPSPKGEGVTVTVAGDDVCIEADERPSDVALMYSALVSSDGGESFIALNHRNQTWYRTTATPLRVSSGICGMTDAAKVSKVKWLFTEPESHRYVATLSYTVTESFGGHKIAVTCTAALDITTTVAHPRELWPSKTLFSTQQPSVDARIAADLARVQGFPMRIALTSGRQYKGGALYTTKWTLVTQDVRTVPDGKVRACVRPPDYREQEPVLGVPGR